MPRAEAAAGAAVLGRVSRWRGVALLAAVIALHVAVLAGLPNLRGVPQPAPPVLETLLLKPQPVRTEAAAPREPAPKPRTPPRPQEETAAAPPAAAMPSAAEPAASFTPAAPAAQEAAAPVPTPAVARAAVDAEPRDDGERFDLPPAVKLKYKIAVNGAVNGDGEIAWQTDGKSYRLDINYPIFFSRFIVLSVGAIDAFGLAPERYEETRPFRAMQATNFNRDARRSITFSRVTSSLPLIDGAQDRFSVVFQLVSLVRGNPQRDEKGVTRAFYIADSDSGETWKIQCLGDETIDTPRGPLLARHFLRLPRHADDQRRIEIWLGQAQGWLPVMLRLTDSPNRVLDLIYDGQRER